MSFGTLGEYRRRRQRAVYQRFLLFFLLVLTLLGVASYAYQVGVSASEAKADKYAADLERFQSDNLRLRDRLASETEKGSQTGQALAELEQRYALEVPRGELKVLFEAIRERVAAGVSVDRIGLLIDAAGQRVVCSEAPETKRFMPMTPLGSEVVHAVRFGDGRILVRGEGDNANDEEGRAEAWYDPAQPVRLTFSTLAGTREQVEGVLPLEHRMVVGQHEYRFSAIASERAFVEITAEACDLPDIADALDERPEPEAAAEAEPVTSG